MSVDNTAALTALEVVDALPEEKKSYWLGKMVKEVRASIEAGVKVSDNEVRGLLLQADSDRQIGVTS